MFEYDIGQGWVDATTWLVRLPKPDSDSPFLRNGYPVDHAEDDVAFALSHERVHFWQSVSTQFLFWFSANWYLHLGMCKIVLFKGIADLERVRSIVRDSVARFSKILHASVDGVSTSDIIEGHATFIGHRSYYNNLSTHRHFTAYLDRVHPGCNKYSNAYKYVEGYLGECAFEFFSPICYLALQFGHPEKRFVELVRAVYDRRTRLRDSFKLGSTKCSCGNQHGDPPGKDIVTSLLEIIGEPPELCFPVACRTQGLSDRPSAPEELTAKVGDMMEFDREGKMPAKRIVHSILEDYVTVFTECPLSDFELIGMCARPYDFFMYCSPYYTSAVDHTYRCLWPPIFFVESTRQLDIKGVAYSDMTPEKEERTRELLREVLRSSAELGAIKKFVWNEAWPMRCHHRDCPVYSTALCNMFFQYPRHDYRQCAFPRILQDSSLGRLLETSWGN